MKNFPLILGVCFLSFVTGLIFADVGEPPRQTTYEITLFEAIYISLIFWLIYFTGFIAGLKQKQE